MALRIGDRLTDAAGDWEVVGRPTTSVGGKMVRVRLKKIGEPAVTEERSWPAHEWVAVRRAGGA